MMRRLLVALPSVALAFSKGPQFWQPQQSLDQVQRSGRARLCPGWTGLADRFTEGTTSRRSPREGHRKIAVLGMMTNGQEKSLLGASLESLLEASIESASRRLFFQSAALLSCLILPSAASANSSSSDSSISIPEVLDGRATSWPLGKVAFSLLPLAGSYNRRATTDEVLVENVMWTFDQIQGVVNVNVPVRMTVIKLSDAAGGGLWIHNPLAPTPQLLQKIKSLERAHGPVRHIVLGTVALEHKATFGPFAQHFTKTATLWIHPGQWSFPVSLPVEYLGVVQGNDKLRMLPSSQFIHGEISLQQELGSMERRYQYWAKKSPFPEWLVDIDYETLQPLRFKSVGSYSESAFFHKSTKTLIVTDCVCSVTDDPPKIIREDPRAMLYHSRDRIGDLVVNDENTRRKGWRRMVQFGLVFFPSQIEVVPLTKAIRESTTLVNNKSIRTLGEGAVPGTLYPWTWHDNDADISNFNAISQNGSLFCPPILTKLILDREPQRALFWVHAIVTKFDFTHVVPSHLNNYVKATPNEFEKAFDVLKSDFKKGMVYSQRALPEDLALLQEASDLLTRFGVVAESQVCDLEPARKVGRFAAAISPK